MWAEDPPADAVTFRHPAATHPAGPFRRRAPAGSKRPQEHGQLCEATAGIRAEDQKSLGPALVRRNLRAAHEHCCVVAGDRLDDFDVAQYPVQDSAENVAGCGQSLERGVMHRYAQNHVVSKPEVPWPAIDTLLDAMLLDLGLVS